MRGRVIRGQCYAYVWETEHPEMLEAARGNLGWAAPPIPGTLNVALEEDVPWETLDRKELVYGAGNPSYVVEAILRLSDETEIPVGMVRQYKTGTPLNRVELFATQHLRTRYGLEDGDDVEVSWTL